MSSDFKFLKGNIETIILNALYNGDKYGYEISKEIKEKTDNKYEIKQPTLYGYLKRLQEQNLIEAYWGEESYGGRRKYFRLTPEGKTTCEQFMSEWNFHRDILDSLVASPEDTDELPEYTPHENLFLGSKSTRKKRVKKDYKDEEENKQVFDVLMKLSEDNRKSEESDDDIADLSEQNVSQPEQSAAEQTVLSETPTDDSSDYEAPQHEPQTNEEPKPELIRITGCDEKYTPTYTSYHFKTEETPAPRQAEPIETNNQEEPAVYHQEEPKENEQERQYKTILTHLLGEQISDTDEKVAHIAPQLANYQSDYSSENLSLAETADALSKEGYRIRFYNTAAAQYRAVPMLIKNKLNCVTAWATLIIFYLLAALSWLVGGSGADIVIIGLFALGMLLIALFFTYIYITRPNIRVKPTHDFKRSFINKLIIFVFITLVMVSVDLLVFRIDFSNRVELAHMFLLPEFFAAMLPISELVYKYCNKFKTFYI